MFFQTYFSSTICFWYSSYSSLDIPSWDILLVVPASSTGWSQWVWSDDLRKRKIHYSFSFFSESSFILASGLVYQSKSNERLFWARALQTSCITRNILTMTQAKKRGTIFCQIPSAHLSPLFPLSENRLINHLLNICNLVKALKCNVKTKN